MADENEDQAADIVVARRGRPPKERPGSNLFPVKMLRNYHPINDFTIDGEEPTLEQRVKVFAGAEIEMDKEEAKDCFAKGIAVRNDPI